jgi:hypothetical protein
VCLFIFCSVLFLPCDNTALKDVDWQCCNVQNSPGFVLKNLQIRISKSGVPVEQYLLLNGISKLTHLMTAGMNL